MFEIDKYIGGKTFAIIIMAVGLVFQLTYGFSSGTQPGSSISILFLISVAMASPGGILGLIFGIPRQLPAPDNDSNATRQSLAAEPSGHVRMAFNTNLQDVSDWVTKLIVGISLVELTNILSFFHRNVTAISQETGMQKAVIASVILYYLVVGFIMTYYWTQTNLWREMLQLYKEMLQSADEVRRSGGEVKRQAEEVKETISEQERRTEALKERVSEQARMQIIVQARNALNNRDVDVSQKRMHRTYLDEILREEPTNRDAAITRARYAEEEFGQEEGIERAIDILERFSKEKEQRGQTNDADYADAQYNLACYYSRLSAEKPEPQKHELINKALDYLRKAVNILPDRAVLALHDPYFGPIETNDEFRRIIRQQ